MKILMILSNPFLVDPRVYKEAKALVDAGHEVSVIVWDRKKAYSKADTVEKIKILRVHNTGFMRYLKSDFLRNPLWWRRAYKKGLELYKDGFKFDAVHCHDLDTLYAGVKLKKKLGVKLVYDAHEIFGYMIARNHPKFIVNYALNMEKKLIKNVDQVITVNEPLYDYFKSITDKPIEIIMNCKDLISDKYHVPKNDVFTLLYIGVLNQSRMFPEIIDIIGKIEGVRFVVAGKKENLYQKVKDYAKRYSNVEFLGTIPFDEVIPTTLNSNVIVCMIDPSDLNNRIALANKQFEAMVCGRPIITTKRTYVGEITEKLNCGLVINYDKESLKEAVLRLKEDKRLCKKLGENGLDAAKKFYNWNLQKEKLLEMYAKMN